MNIIVTTTPNGNSWRFKIKKIEFWDKNDRKAEGFCRQLLDEYLEMLKEYSKDESFYRTRPEVSNISGVSLGFGNGYLLCNQYHISKIELDGQVLWDERNGNWEGVEIVDIF